MRGGVAARSAPEFRLKRVEKRFGRGIFRGWAHEKKQMSYSKTTYITLSHIIIMFVLRKYYA